MLGWLKRLLRRRPPPPPDPHLDCTVDGKAARLLIIGARGFMLVGTGPGGMRLISQGMACDPERWWRLWSHHTGGEKLRWENGTPFRPPK